MCSFLIDEYRDGIGKMHKSKFRRTAMPLHTDKEQLLILASLSNVKTIINIIDRTIIFLIICIALIKFSTP